MGQFFRVKLKNVVQFDSFVKKLISRILSEVDFTENCVTTALITQANILISIQIKIHVS